VKDLLISSLVVVAIFLAQAAPAQTLVNGSFETGDFTGWQVTMGVSPGSPIVITSGPTTINGSTSNVQLPAQGIYQAFIQSTGSASVGQAIPVLGPGGLDDFLGTILPGDAAGPVVNGEAIQQTFTTLGSAKITFSYAFQSKEVVGLDRDETGYVLNGVFVSLANPASPGVSAANSIGGAFVGGLPGYQTVAPITVGAGTHTLGFVAYNTGDPLATSALFVDNIIVTPLFGTDPGLTPNQQAVADYIDEYNGTTGGNFAALVTALSGAGSVATLGGYLDQLSPQSLQVFRRIAFDNATFTTLDVNNHLANLRDGLTGFDGSQLTVSDPGLSHGASQINHHLRDMKAMQDPKEMEDPKEMQPVPGLEPADRWSTFIVGDVILADLSHDQDLAHQDYTTGSVLLGADYRLDQHFTAGALLAYSHTDADLDNIGSTATVDTYSVGVYGSYVDGGWYGNALFAYGYNSYTEDRTISIAGFSGTDYGAPQGNQYTGSLTGGYEFRCGDFKYGPIAGVQYVNLGIDSFSEEGPTALNVQSESDESFRSQLGVEMRYAARAGSVYLVPHASATWQHEFLDDSNGITSQFNQIGAGSFTVLTTPTDRDSALIDVGLDANVAENVTLFADYQTEAGEDHYFAQSVQAGVKVSF
jgi:uncharacterized protein with beta-barrel porin domain